MRELKARRTLLSITVALFLVGGLIGCASTPFTVPELTAADKALEAARQAGKDKECPTEFNAAAKVVEEAHAVCTFCKRDEAIAKANRAIAMINALCPKKVVKAAPAPAPAPAPPPAAPAPMVSISADPGSVKQGQCATLSWSTSNASSASINQGVGSVDANGSRKVCPNDTTQYTITASGDGGTRDASTTVSVTRRVIDKMTIHVNFDFDKSTIRKADDADLQKAIDFIKKYPASKISLVGYTDSIGTPEYNQKLSERRAAAVKDYLASHGVEGSRIETSGRGENDPIADNKTAKGRFENRRVEVQILSD
jgi:OmpA-OmpF porin, OOP family